MPVFRRRLYCHYCGKKSNQTNLRTFECEHCEAVNYLDKNGDILDPPVASPAVRTQFAKPQPFTTHSIFCNHCLKNQDIVARLVADFVPDEREPGYRAALAGLPAYRARLEQDYPQCCAQCEPRAQQQLSTATKTAAADHMRRQVQKSKIRRHITFDWRHVVIRAAGIGYLVSIIIQLAWHFFGAQGPMRPTYQSPVQCLRWPAPALCLNTIASLLPLSMIAGCACLWWNPVLTQKVVGKDGKLTGLANYYALQIVVFILRLGSWTLLTDVTLDERLRSILHSTSLIALTVLTLSSQWLVKVDTSPIVNWGYRPPRLVSDGQFVPPPVQEEPSFPLHNLAPPQQDLRPWRPPTPPAEDDDAMDWTPSQSFHPRQPKPRQIEPSSFYGRLPTLPGGVRKPEPKQSIGLPPGFFDKRDRLPRKESMANTMAEPRFFPSTIDTGLENMFGQVFSLGDTPRRASFVRAAPSIPPDASHLHDPTSTTTQPHTSTPNLPPFLAAILTMLLALWLVSSHLHIAIPNLRVYIAWCAVLPPTLRILKSTTFALAAFVSETVLLALFAVVISGNGGVVIFKLGAGLLSLLIVQEVVLYSQQGQHAQPDPPYQPPSLGHVPGSAQFDHDTTPRAPTTAFTSPTRRESTETATSSTSINTDSTNGEWQTPRAVGTRPFEIPSDFSMGGLRLDRQRQPRRAGF